jgi:hypothetical protein
MALVLAVPAAAAMVQIQDDANVLNATSVQNEAARLPVGMYIWTTQDVPNKSQFDTEVQQKVSSEFPIAMGIDVGAQHESIQIGSASGLTQSAAISAEDSANNAFTSVMRSRTDFTGAVQAALNSLNSSLASRGGANGSRSGSHGVSWGVGIVVLIILVVVIALLGRLFRGMRGAGRRGYRGGYGPPPGGGYGPGPGPYGPNYGPGYGPGYGGGMSRGGAAGLGAVGGGLVGYELGKMAGENEQFRHDEMGGVGNQGGWDNNQGGWDNGGGDQGGNWVVGQDSDWGGGGGGGDFGGGGGDNGGGGGNW